MDEEKEEHGIEQIIEQLLSALSEGEGNVHALLEEMRPEDIAEALDALGDEEMILIVHCIDKEIVADVLSNVEPDTLQVIMDNFGPEFIAEALDQMPTEDAAEIIDLLDVKSAAKLLELMKKETSVKRVLEYPEDTAGRFMSTHYIALNENLNPEKAIEYLRQKKRDENYYYVYVVDNDNKYKGLISIQELIFSHNEQTLGDLVEDQDIVAVPVEMDQENVAKLVEKYDMPALPVLDEDGRLVGRITVDDVIDVIREEHTEDMSKMAGTTDEELFAGSALKVARIRMPWLLACILGSLMSGAVIRFFELTLTHAIALVSFIPVIMSTGGNTGLQSCTVMVRRLALGSVSSYNVMENIFKEVRTALILGVVCGSFLYLITFFWRHNAYLGFIIGTSMFFAVSISSIVGMFIPIFFKRVNIDPAIASGPLITTINDIIGLAIYLLLSSLFLAHA